MSGGQGLDACDDLVVVPRVPGGLIRPGGRGRRRRRDELDDMIDDLLPDTTEGPGPTDAALVLGGGALMSWTALGNPPAAVPFLGVVGVGLGCILPLRAAYRWLAGRRRSSRRAALLGRGVPLRAGDPTVARLVAAYEALDGLPGTPDPAVAAAHGAVLEVASLLEGRAPVTNRERSYVDVRAGAVEELVRVLQAVDEPISPAGLPVALVVEAREELDALSGLSALSRLDDVTEEARARGRRH